MSDIVLFNTFGFDDQMQRQTSSLATLYKESRRQEKESRKQLKSIGWEV